MGDLSTRLLALRPVVFRTKPEVQSGERDQLEYGLMRRGGGRGLPGPVVYAMRSAVHRQVPLLSDALAQRAEEGERAPGDGDEHKARSSRSCARGLATLEGRLDAPAAPVAAR